MNFFNSFINFFKDGGFFLYPLALIFVVGVSIAIERYVYLTRETIRNRGLWDELVPALSTGNFKQVVALTQNSKASIATILNYGVARVASARRRDDIEKAMDESLLEVIPRIEKRTHYLSSLANVGLLIGLLGTIMAANVWMRIWPNQRKIIAGVKGTGPAADPSIPALAALRSKHNTYMSVPLIFFMVSNHFPTVYGSDYAWITALIFVAVGWGATKFLYNKSASPAPAQF